ncbi:nicotinamidase/pyrazinamidase [compost metagenome]
MTNTALIVVDIQNDYFSGGKWELNATDSAADNAARVIGAARERGDVVIHIRHETLAPDAPFFVPGSDGAQLHEKVRN